MAYGDTLDEQRRKLLEFLAGRGATSPGFGGLRNRAQSAVGRMGGLGGVGPLPNLTYNPFFSQVAGRNERFPQLPNGVTPGAVAAVQAGTQVPGGVTAGPGAAPLAQQPAGGAPGGRNLIGVAPTPPPGSPIQPQAPQVDPNIAAQLSPWTQPQLTPIDPYATLRRIGGSGIGRY